MSGLEFNQGVQQNHQATFNIRRLPNEILIKILSFVQTRDLLTNIANVSRHFYESSKDPHAHICITLFDTIELNSFVKFLQNKVYIKEVNILRGKQFPIYCNVNSDAFVQCLSACKKLMVLNVEASYIFRHNQLISFLKHPNSRFLKKLSYKTLGNVDNTDWTCYASNLTHLKLNYQGSKDIDTLIKIGQTAKKLECLSLERIHNSDLNMTHFIQTNQQTLKELHCRDYGWSDEELGYLSQCYKLESLNIRFLKQISKKTFWTFTEDKWMRRLQLRIYLDTINSNDVFKLINQPNMSLLTFLYLSLYNTKERLISTEVMEAIKALKFLKTLHLRQSFELEESYAALFEILSTCSWLEELFLTITFEFSQDEFKQLVTRDFINLKCFLIQYPGADKHLDKEFIVECLKKSKSMKFLEFCGELYYKEETITSESFYEIDYEEFYKKFPEADKEINTLLRPIDHYYYYTECHFKKYIIF